jgi:hypothetical protein
MSIIGKALGTDELATSVNGATTSVNNAGDKVTQTGDKVIHTGDELNTTGGKLDGDAKTLHQDALRLHNDLAFLQPLNEAALSFKDMEKGIFGGKGEAVAGPIAALTDAFQKGAESLSAAFGGAGGMPDFGEMMKDANIKIPTGIAPESAAKGEAPDLGALIKNLEAHAQQAANVLSHPTAALSGLNNKTAGMDGPGGGVPG